MEPKLDVTEPTDRRSTTRFAVGVLALCVLVTLADGYNISVTSFAAPRIAEEWRINHAALGPLFSSSLIAGLIGPFLFGALGDRIGRRNAVLASTAMIGVFGVISGLCASLAPLVIVRFIAGVGMSGALTVTVALGNEFAPRRLRATFVTIVFSGTTLGSGAPGLIAPALLAHHGWRSLFFVGGAVPLVLVAALAILLPESPEYLSLKGRHRDESVAPRRSGVRDPLVPGAGLALAEPVERSGLLALKALFSGRLALLTPLLWFGAFLAMIIFYSFNSWLPTLLTDAGVPFARASLSLTLFQFVGTLGGWAIMLPLDRYGMIPCTALYALSVPIVAILGHTTGSGAPPLLLVSAAGFCILGLQFAQVACASSIYPTHVRATGVGSFMLFARAGGAVGPAIVGVLVGRHADLRELFYLAAIPLVIGTAASAAVTMIYNASHHRVARAEPHPHRMQAPL